MSRFIYVREPKSTLIDFWSLNLSHAEGAGAYGLCGAPRRRRAAGSHRDPGKPNLIINFQYRIA